MRAALLRGPGQLAVEEWPDPVAGIDDVVVAVRGSGICGTDLHLVAGDISVKNLPLIPGHEVWGEVVNVGADVKRVEVGDRVAIDPSLHCGRCGPCRAGHGNMCETWGAVGATVAGGWADFVLAPAANVYRLPEAFPLEAAVLLEPVACAIRGLERLAAKADQRVIVFGGGTIGVLLAILLQARGVGPVTIVDINPMRRESAAALTGCDVRAPAEITGDRASWVIEATGDPSAFQQALDCVDRAGTLLVFGVASPQTVAPVSPYRIYADELTIVGSMAILRSFPAAVDAVSRHANQLAPLVTHRFGLDDIGAALGVVRSGAGIKTVLVAT